MTTLQSPIDRRTSSPRSVFADRATLFTRYRARVQFRDKLLGGVPRDPRLIEGWLRGKAGLSDTNEIRHMMLRTLAELGADVDEDMSFEQLERASEAVAARKQTSGFKVGEYGLYAEARQVKAMLKESVNIVFGGERFGPTRKGARPYLAERVFVEPDQLWLGADEPHGVELSIGHVFGPAGPRNVVGYHEYVRGAALDLEILVLRDCLSADQWASLSILFFAPLNRRRDTALPAMVH